MARDAEMEMFSALTDECPPCDAVAGHFGRPIDGLDLADGTFVIFDEVLAIESDGESAPGVEDDIDDVIAGVSRKESSDEVGVEIGSSEARIERLRERGDRCGREETERLDEGRRKRWERWDGEWLRSDRVKTARIGDSGRDR